MYLSKRATGYYYIYYIDEQGKHQGISTKTSIKSEALRFLTSFKNKVKEKQSLPAPIIQLSQFKYEFLKHSKAIHTEKTTKTFITTFKFFEEQMGNVPLSSILEKNIKQYIDYRITNASVYQARKDLINLSSCFNWAISEGYIQTNPCSQVNKVRVPQKMPIFFTEDEFKQLLEVIDSQDIRDIFIFAVNTGCRQMELLTIEWSQIDLNRNILLLDNHNHITKSKKIRSIPLNRNAIDVVSRRKMLNNISQKVFTLKGKEITAKQIQTKSREYIKLAGLNTKLNFHSLRHTFASWLVQRGVSIYEVSKLLGHSDLKVTQIYAHLRQENLENAVNKL